MATKVYITGTTHNCKECPFRSYYSGGIHECTKTGAHLPPGKAECGIPEWCPLPLHPAHAITRLELKLSETEQALTLAANPEFIKAAAEALSILNGHDCSANLIARYGKNWWDAITGIEANLRKMIPKG